MLWNSLDRYCGRGIEVVEFSYLQSQKKARPFSLSGILRRCKSLDLYMCIWVYYFIYNLFWFLLHYFTWTTFSGARIFEDAGALEGTKCAMNVLFFYYFLILPIRGRKIFYYSCEFQEVVLLPLLLLWLLFCFKLFGFCECAQMNFSGQDFFYFACWNPATFFLHGMNEKPYK